MRKEAHSLQAHFTGGKASGSATLTLVDPPSDPPIDFWEMLGRFRLLDWIAETAAKVVEVFLQIFNSRRIVVD